MLQTTICQREKASLHEREGCLHFIMERCRDMLDMATNIRREDGEGSEREP